MVNKIDKKILIVEDDDDLLYILKMKFSEAGFSVAAAKDGETGIGLAEKENPDLIISDVLMPRMSGPEMAKKIREANKSVQVIFLTNVKDGDYAKGEGNPEGFEYLIKSDMQIDDIIEKAKAKLGIGKAEIPSAPKKK